jgi:putative oxidoreductase
LLIGLPFIASGFSKVMDYGSTIRLIESSSLPLPPPLAYIGAVIVELGCGILMIAGFRTRIAALVLVLFCFATAIFFHAHFDDPNQTFHFIKNLVMAGGLLQLVTYGAGPISIDNRHSKPGAATGQTASAD